jgi:hypothetical protein
VHARPRPPRRHRRPRAAGRRRGQGDQRDPGLRHRRLHADHRSVLRGFEQGTELAEAAPAGRHSAYELRIRVRDDTGASVPGWTTLWLPGAHLIAFDDGQPGATFTPVEPAVERALARAARGHTARAARRYATPPPPAARVAEIVPAPPAAARAQSGSSGPPALAWTGLAAVVLVAAGAWRARRR